MTTKELSKISVETMKSGDILVFEGEKGDWISEAIMWLTDSTVSHAALYMQTNPPALADAALAGLDMHEVADAGDPLRPVHVSRLKNAEALDLSPVIKAGQNYVSQNLCYPKAELVLLAMVLVYKKLTHVSLKQAIVIKLLRLATAEIKTILEKTIYDGKHPMVCSEFVYQCYLDASKENPQLKLDLHNADANASLKSSSEISLVDHLEKHLSNKTFPNEGQLLKSATTKITETAEELAKKLKDSAENEIHNLYEDNNELSEAVHEFVHHHAKILNRDSGNLKALISNARSQQAFFVTPNDLYKHISNTNNLGEFSIYRNSKKMN